VLYGYALSCSPKLIVCLFTYCPKYFLLMMPGIESRIVVHAEQCCRFYITILCLPVTVAPYVVLLNGNHSSLSVKLLQNVVGVVQLRVCVASCIEQHRNTLITVAVNL